MKMNIFFTTILLLQTLGSLSMYCSKKELFVIGSKTFCESESGISISCLVNPVKAAYIRCDRYYSNERNISEQVIDCTEDNKWSEPPIRCLPTCSSIPEILEKETITLVNSTEMEYPKWYAEVIRKVPNDTKSNIFPAIILSERHVLVNSENLNEENNANDFLIRILKPNSSPKEYKTSFIISHNSSNYGFLIPQDDYIKYDEWTQPACHDLNLKNLLTEDVDVNYVTPDALQLLPTYEGNEGKCILPEIDNTKIDIQCIKKRKPRLWLLIHSYEFLSCTKTVEGFITRCPIGYKNEKLNGNDEILTKCYKNDWEYFGDYNDCKLICGEIDTKNKILTTPLLYKGNKSDITLVPWHVGIYSNNTKANTFDQICGGTIIHTNVIISAAHCFYDTPKNKISDASKYLIGAGKTYRDYEALEMYEYYVKIKEIGFPPNYNPYSIGNDIAILILDEHLKYSSHIRPVCIDWESDEYYYMKNGINGTVAGWGATSKDNEPSEELLTINLTTVTNNECKKLVLRNLRSHIVGEKFCATNGNNSAACGGDSGGGFVIKKKTKFGERYFLLGVVSIGIGIDNYCSDQFITLFTNIQFHQSMIKEIISKSRVEKLRPTSLLYPYYG